MILFLKLFQHTIYINKLRMPVSVRKWSGPKWHTGANSKYPVFLYICLSFILLLGACDDPSNVGIGLIDEEGGHPVRTTLTAVASEREIHNEVTGTQVPTQAFDGPLFALTGFVSDPLVGDTRADGHVDFSRPPTLPEGFANEEVVSAELRLMRTYAYGDTTGSATLYINEITTAWEANGYTADTTLAIGDQILQHTFDLRDSLVVIQLPESWIDANDALLRGTAANFVENFHGFQLQTVDGNAIAGFDGNESVLRVDTAEESVDFEVSKVFSAIQHEPAANLPQNRQVVHKGVGTAASYSFPLAEELKTGALNQVEVVVTPDLSLFENTEPGFVRPMLTNLTLYGVTEDGEMTSLQHAEFDEENGYFRFSGGNLRLVFRDVLQGHTMIERFVIRPRTIPVNANVVFLKNETADEGPPQITFTYVAL